jgi:hypothetical protein
VTNKVTGAKDAAVNGISRALFGGDANPMHPSQYLLKRHQRGPRRA